MGTRWPKVRVTYSGAGAGWGESTFAVEKIAPTDSAWDCPGLTATGACRASRLRVKQAADITDAAGDPKSSRLIRRCSSCSHRPPAHRLPQQAGKSGVEQARDLERETGFEPATPSLGSLCSTN